LYLHPPLNLKKMKMKSFLTGMVFLFAGTSLFAAKSVTVTSPDQKIRVEIQLGEKILFKADYANQPLFDLSPLSMKIKDGAVLGVSPKLTGKPVYRSVNTVVKPLYGMASEYADVYNEVALNFNGNYSVIFRVYDNGLAYRFVTRLPGTIQVADEEVDFRFYKQCRAMMHRVPGFESSYEEHYIDQPFSYLDSNKIASLPLYVDAGVAKVVITESDLLDYPGLYLTWDGGTGLRGSLPKAPAKTKQGGFNGFNVRVLERHDYLASTSGTRSFPWRLAVIVPEDKDLLYNNLTYLLASENKIGDASWIKPGKVAWDWWNANNLTGVPFKTGFNTETYKYFIDFAARNGFRYINLDEGWSDQFDLLKVNDGTIKIGTNPTLGASLDMQYLFKYAKEKNVGIILWCVWHTLDRQMEEALTQFEKWGVAGLKVDFMDRDDQEVVNFYERLAREAAKRHMLVNFHGAFKPTGLERAYPNVINREAVQGLEYNKFSNKATPEHAVSIPFIRMVAGSMDYTPGALNNVNAEDFRIVSARPVSQGTRCQQLAMYVVLYAPLEMTSDAPTAYEKEPDILNFLAGTPTVWDETKPLEGKAADYLMMARRKGDTWWVGAMTDWNARDLKLDLSFLKEGSYTLELFRDGANAARVGNDYVREVKTVKAGEIIPINMAPGGGWAARISPVK
jgi:alpha-glucosidase